MKTESTGNSEFRAKIKKGLDLTRKKLLESKRKTNSSLVYSENGRIIEVKASDIKD